jgi:nucleotide-binding universal stress UspA family protein
VSERPVLCAFDASEPSLLAAHVAAWLAGALSAALELVYVVDHDELPALPRSGATADPQVRDKLYEIQERVAEEAARAELAAALSAPSRTETSAAACSRGGRCPCCGGWPPTTVRHWW